MTTRHWKNGGVHQLVFMLIAALALTVGASRVAATDWLMYGFNLQRTGENPFETTLTRSTVGGLHLLWSFDIGAVTIMQPVLATGVIVHGSPKDLVYIGAEHGDLYAIDVATGAMVWHKNLDRSRLAAATCLTVFLE
jgi:glucose dehydrogenase